MLTARRGSKAAIYTQLNTFENRRHIKMIFVPVPAGLSFKETKDVIDAFLKTRPMEIMKIADHQPAKDMIKVVKV